MRWANDWQKSEGYDHKLRVMLGFDAERIDHHREEYPLERLARLWKSYVSKDAYEDKSSSLPGGRF